MSRPAATRILELKATSKDMPMVVMSVEGVYAVMYKGEPINICSQNEVGKGHQQPVYKKINFATSGAAFNRARTLNKRSGTNDFSVFRMCKAEELKDGE